MERPIVIAHRGASGYLPEHTAEATSLAYGMLADVIEQDVVLTRDGVPIVLHDVFLDTVTDVPILFPDRSRQDGRWYAIDFTLAEIKSLHVHERVDWPRREVVFPERFPLGQGTFRIATLADMIELVQGLNRSSGRDVGLYPELKQPAWHRREGHDLAKAMLAVLGEYGYSSRAAHVYLQCFEAAELRRLRMELNCRMRLVQLIANDDKSSAMWTTDGLAKIARYADGVGPSINRIVTADADGRVTLTPLVMAAHERGLVVHPYTVRRDDLPDGFESEDQLINACQQAGVDGLFCDFPDRAIEVLKGLAR